MRIALSYASPTARMYPVSLLKIGAMLKQQGHECALFINRLPESGLWDAAWISTCFTFDIPQALAVVREAVKRYKTVRVGGVAASLIPKPFEDCGVDVHRGLIPEAEACAPDYSLLGFPPEYSITHTSRGCTRKCGFCMVTKLEPKFESRHGWERDIHPATNRVLFYDNNWLGKPEDEWLADVKRLRELCAAGTIKEFDFNQALDCRLMTEAKADALRGLPMRPVRFAFDGKQEDGYYQRAVEMMIARGFRTFRSYVLYNFMDTPQDFYYRLRVSVELAQKYSCAVESFPMRYQPILELDQQRRFVGKHWQKRERDSVNVILGAFGFGQVSCHAHHGMTAIEEFEYWFGKTADDFVKLLNYPKLRELMQRRKGALSMARAKARVQP